ncbi:MAG TPA: ethanolamine utilization protein EutN, partial [Candidatus Marinimicrobia bacterium]|nr:ethanolamine utilization protein EutN [Candidatus Neomarinimicrobiota bacterium]
VKNHEFDGHKLMIVRTLSPELQPLPEISFLAVDIVSAGIGDIVLINREGSGARLILKNEKIPLQSVIVGIIDQVEVFE